MAFDFPSAPSVGQEFTSGAVAYVFNGTGWTVKPAQSNISAGDIVFPPSGNIAGDSALEAIQELDTEKVAKTGDTMTGHLILPTSPAASNAVRKDYVDSAITTLDTSLRAYAAPFDAMAYNGMQVNGGMEVSQERGYLNPSTVNTYVCDGVNWVTVGSMVAPRQVHNAAVFNGFNNFLNVGVSTAQTSLGVADISTALIPIEGYRVSRLAWGTSSAQPITVGFWICHVRTGTYSISVRNSASNRSYCATYTQSASNVPEYKTITIPGDTTGTWLKTNGIGLYLTFTMASGSNYIAPSNNTWVNGDFSVAIGQVNGVAATSDTFRITGLTVLPGPLAPTAAQSPLIMRPYGEELLLCRRYYEQSSPLAAYTASDGSGVQAMVVSSIANGVFYVSPRFSVQKRAGPTIITYPYTTPSNTNRSSSGAGTDFGANSAAPYGPNLNSFTIWNNSGGALAVGTSLFVNWIADARL